VADSDSLYHRLFSIPCMVEMLVREFVVPALAAHLDFSRLQRVNAKFHTDRTACRREGDVIWRVPAHGGTDIYLLLEFQSRIDWYIRCSCRHITSSPSVSRKDGSVLLDGDHVM